MRVGFFVHEQQWTRKYDSRALDGLSERIKKDTRRHQFDLETIALITKNLPATVVAVNGGSVTDGFVASWPSNPRSTPRNGCQLDRNTRNEQ